MEGPNVSKKKTFAPPWVSLGESGGLIWQCGTVHAQSQSLPHVNQNPISPSGTSIRTNVKTEGPTSTRATSTIKTKKSKSMIMSVSSLTPTQRNIVMASGTWPFKTMKEDWKAVQNGTGAVRLEKWRSTLRKSSRKMTHQKAANRRWAPKESGLDLEEFKFLIDPSFQSYVFFGFETETTESEWEAARE
ncbi:hypothetical protein FRC11_009749 [Ceratobasidium sp. 423]|nr:hypothetical protein FRC11_009749 [Ceratobasidium sp. 423]